MESGSEAVTKGACSHYSRCSWRAGLGLLLMHVQLDLCKNVIYPHFMAGKPPSQSSKIKIPRVTGRPQAEQVWVQVGPGLSHGDLLLFSHSNPLPAQLAHAQGQALTVSTCHLLEVLQQLCDRNKVTASAW